MNLNYSRSIKNGFLIAFILFLSKEVQGQSQSNTEVKFAVDSLLILVKEKSLYTEKVNWPKVQRKALKLAEGKETIDQAYEAFQYIFSSVQDYHGMIRVNKQEFRLTDNYTLKQDSLIVAEISKGPLVVAQQFDNIGYIRIPHMPFAKQTTIDKYANMLNDSICKISSSGVKGWVVDLRLNVGGNFRPMIAGIANLLCDGLWISFVENQGKTSDVIEIRNGQLLINSKQETTINSTCKQSCKLPIAVLIGPSTGSSGEATAVALTGRENTRFFGQPSFGFANVTQGYYLANRKIYILLTTAQLKNNKGKKFNRVTPDSNIKDSFQLDYKKDKLIEAAIEWLDNVIK